MKFGYLRVAEPHARSAAVPSNELDPGRLKGALNDVQGRAPRGGIAPLKLSDCYHPNTGPVSQLLLGPVEKAARGPALRWRDHQRLLSRFWCF